MLDKLIKEINQIKAYANRQQSYGASPARIAKLQRNQERLQEIAFEISQLKKG